MTHAAAFDADEAREIMEGMRHLEGPLLPILHALQARFGHIGEAAIRLVSAELNLSRAEVHGVASFYHDFRTEPHGRHVVKLCRAEACQANGGDGLADAMEQGLGLKLGETSRDGQVTLEAVYCLGLCAVGPSAMVDGRLVGRLSPGRLGPILEEVRL